MAANFWRLVLGVQLLLAAGVALASGWFAGIIVLIAIQYLLVAFVSLASGTGLPGAREPLFLWLVELSMAVGPSRRSTSADGGSHLGPLLLVHGLACNSGAWRWLWPRLQAAGFGPIHAIDLEPLTADLDYHASRLAQALKSLHQTHGHVPVTVLAHSMGGLVSRAALREIEPRIVRRLVTLATPHHGTRIARRLDTKPVSQMRVDSPWLAALNAQQEGRLPVPLVSFFSRDDEFVAPASSARLAGAEHVALDGCGHFELLVSRRAIERVLQSLREAA